MTISILRIEEESAKQVKAGVDEVQARAVVSLVEVFRSVPPELIRKTETGGRIVDLADILRLI